MHRCLKSLGYIKMDEQMNTYVEVLDRLVWEVVRPSLNQLPLLLVVLDEVLCVRLVAALVVTH